MSKTEHGVTAMGVMALELTGGTAPERGALAPEQAGMLAERIGRDLAQWIPEVREPRASAWQWRTSTRPKCCGRAGRCTAGWTSLHARAPGRDQGPRVLAFGADAQGEIPCPSRPTRS